MTGASESEFKSAVEAAAAMSYRVAKVAVEGFVVVLSVRTNSGKGHWNSRCEFDPDSGDVSCTTYPGSNIPFSFFRLVREQIRDNRGS